MTRINNLSHSCWKAYFNLVGPTTRTRKVNQLRDTSHDSIFSSGISYTSEATLQTATHDLVRENLAEICNCIEELFMQEAERNNR